MKEKQKLKNSRGITLVALVVTIIVLVILAGVSITAVLSQNGVVGQAKEAKEKTLNAELHEQELMNEVVDYIQNNGVKLISKDKSYVGYYADVDGDGIADGVIYADLATGGSGAWGPYDEDAFSYEAIEGTKNYYVSQTNYEGSFGTKDVLTAKGSGKDRFYVMSLTDVKVEETGQYIFAWYDAAQDSGISDYKNLTSINFGSGMTNTKTMMEKWNNSIYGEQNAGGYWIDIWGVIQDDVEKGWFIPSIHEILVFTVNLAVSKSNYSSLGFDSSYWSSSILDSTSGYTLWLSGDSYNARSGNGFATTYGVRLSTTF